jgi:hypothetical protein
MQVIPIATPTPGGFSLENTGDGILYINGIILPSEIAITNPPPPIAYPIVLQPGEKIGVSISLVSNIYVDSTIPIKFICESPCSPDDTLWVHYLVSKREVIPAGFTFPDTYIDCRESNGTVSLTNKGTTPINLHSVEFISDPPTYVDPDQFVFQSNGTQLLNYAPVLAIAPGKTETIPVVFKPTRTGALGTKVRFAYDSAGIVKDTVYAINVGNGVKLKNTFNVANAGGPFKYETGQFFDLPITLTDPIENNAGVYGSKFTVTYKRDVIDFKSVRGEGNQTIVGTPTPVPDGSGNETITIETRGGQITQAGAVASIHFLVVVAKDKQTDIVVADGELKDNVGATLCYFDKQYVPGSFEPIYLCGDPSLNQYLNGAFKPTKITQLTPNPSNGTGKVTLSYDVNVKDLPITVELFNVMGDKVQTLVDKKTMTEGGHTLSISTKNIPAGTYTVRISANNDSESENFVITK